MKMNCDIIKDLIPSYVDDICSEATRECVKEHIAECNECRKMVDIYKYNELSADSLEKKQLDGFKKIKDRLKLTSVISVGFFIGFIVFGVYVMEFSYNPLPEAVYYVLLFMALVGANAVVVHQGYEKDKSMALRIIASVILIIYAIGVLVLTITSVIHGNNIFGMSDADVGPFLHINTGIVLLIQACFIGYELYLYVSKSRFLSWIMNINIIGSFLLLSHMSLLKRLSDLGTYFVSFARITLLVVIVGGIGVSIGCLINKKMKNYPTKF